jgi:cyclic-di-AMP phosphodiesterase PgpH
VLRSARRTGSPTVAGAALFALVQTVALVLALFPLLPGRLHAAIGQIAAETITAPRDFSYSSDVVRQRLREEAAKSVPDVITYDVNVPATQLAALDLAIASLDASRATAGPGGTPSSPAGSRLAIAPAVRGAALSLTDGQWATTASAARQVLTDVLHEPFTPETTESKRTSVPGRLSPSLDPVARGIVAALVQPLIVATEAVDSTATEAQRQRAIDAVPPQVRHFAQNQDIVRQGEPIDASDLEALRASGHLSARLPVAEMAALTVTALATSLIIAAYLLSCQPAGAASRRRLGVLAVAVAGLGLTAKLYFSLVTQDPHRSFLLFAIPVALVPMLAASLFDLQFAILISALTAALLGFTAVFTPQLAGYLGPSSVQLTQMLFAFLLSGLAGIFALRRAERLSGYLVAAAAAGMACFLGAAGLWWLEAPRRPIELLLIAAACAAASALTGLLTIAGIVLLGPLLKIGTRLQLMELGQLNAPLLRRLQEEAPGTFHHSIIVGNLAERAATGIGADALLVRVGCYYHDIGKMSRPGFFVENQLNGETPHDRLAPVKSAQIIADHVRDGDALARQYRLPEVLRAFIAQHHGTRMVSYFYRKAAAEDADVDAGLYTYPGPRPASRETAIVMLADSIEAAARAAAQRSPEQIDALVEDVISERLSEGQLDDCELTMRDLRAVAESFKVSLRAIYHPRIEYPSPTGLEEARRRRHAGAAD